MADPTIRELITKIENNIIQLPVFQRAFVWDGNKVQKFVESLYKGYPTGSFLMWTVTKKKQGNTIPSRWSTKTYIYNVGFRYEKTCFPSR